MSRNGSGVFSAPSSSWNPAVAGTIIDQTDWAALLADFAAAITASIANDGQTTCSAQIPFAAGLKTSDGLLATPAITFTADTDNGFCRIGANDWVAVAAGANVLEFTSVGLTASYVGIGSAPNTSYRLILVANGVGKTAATMSVDDATAPTLIFNQKATSGDNLFINFNTEAGDTLRGSIDYNRAGGAVRYNTTSSAQFKTAIVDLPQVKHDELSSVVDTVQLREFEWKENPGIKTFGVVTEELAQIYPDAVTKDGSQYDRSMLIFPLLAKCRALEARLAALEAKA